MKTKFIGAALAVIMLSGSVTPVNAGSKGRKNTTIALGAATIYGIVKKKPVIAVAGGLGTIYAYSRYKSAKKSEKLAEARRQRWYRARYRRSWRNYYKKGN